MTGCVSPRRGRQWWAARGMVANTVDLLTNNHVSPHASKEDAVALAYSYSALALVQHTTTNSDTSILCKCKCLRGSEPLATCRDRRWRPSLFDGLAAKGQQLELATATL
eukprot:scaffold98640_cov33-Tisochrysis_lutea.AAC.2